MQRNVTGCRSVLVATRLIAVLAVATTAKAQVGGTDVNADPDPVVTQNEISLTLVPGTLAGQPQVLLAAYNDNPYPAGNGLGVSYSTNGGTTWKSAQLPFPTSSISGLPLVWAFDPTATADTQGRLFVAHIAADGNAGGISGLYVRRSTDGGVSWSGAVEVAADRTSALGPGDPNYLFNDRDQITADRFAASPYKDYIYIAWIKDRGYAFKGGPLPPYSDIYFARSIDGGVTFSTPQRINDVPGNDMGNMPIPRVAADGTVLVSWLDYNVWTGGTGRILLDKSADAGQTWGTDQLVATINLPPLNVTDGSGNTDALAKGAPVLATSPSDPNGLYLAYAADPDGPLLPDEADIFLIRSTDQGTTWSTPIRLNTDSTTNDQILPWIDVKPSGVIDVAWYDRQNDVFPASPLPDRLWDVFIAKSIDGGNSFLPEVRLNDQSFSTPLLSPSGGWMGEYLGLAVDSTHAYIVWTSSSSDPLGDIHFDKIANASLSPPLCVSSPETGCRQAATGKSTVRIRDHSDNSKDQLKWKWNRGDLTELADFQDPVNGSATYRVCLYDSSATSQPLVEMDVPPGGMCGTKPCWKAMQTKGFNYKDKAATSDGIRSVKLKAGATGEAKVHVQARGANFQTPALPLTMPVTVQLLIDDGTTTECWRTTFTETPIKTDAEQFKAKQ